MKSKLLIILLLICVITHGQSVPNTTTFSLQDVVNVTGGTSLSAAFTNSVDSYFDASYKGSKDNLLNFRNYTVGSSCPSVGDSYGGGIVAYLFQSGDNGYISGECHGIIAASSDQSSGIQWYNGTYVDISTLSSDLHAGTTNTNDILYVQGYNYIDYAAGLARSYSGGGFSDWCLPSLNDLLKLYDNRLSVGGFSASKYWASGQRFGSATASMVDFSNGDYSQDYNKAFLHHVRAIRYF